MKVRITVWTLAWDTREGTDCQVFCSEDELEAHLAHIIRDDISAVANEEMDAIRILLDTGVTWKAWESWCEKFKDPLDTYSWGMQPLEIELAETEHTIGV